MKALVLVAPGRAELQELPEPVPSEDEVLIRVEAAGICGSDVHALEGTHPTRRPPMIFGHEIAGTIVTSTAATPDLRHGDRVTVRPQVSCGLCIPCGRNDQHLCQNRRTPGTGTWPGGVAEYFVAPSDTVYRLPDAMPQRTGVLAEPLAVGVHAVRVADATIGDRLLVIGAGPIGALTATAARARGISEITLSEPNSGRRDLVTSLGFRAIDPDGLPKVSRPEGGYDAVFLTAVTPVIVASALDAVRPGGRIIIVGVSGTPIEVDLNLVQTREIRLLGSMIYGEPDFLEAIDILNHDSALSQLVTHRYSLDDSRQGLMAATDKRGRVMKVVVEPDWAPATAYRH